MTVVQPLHTVVVPEPDNPSDFNPSVSELRSQYMGHVGHCWSCHHIKYNGDGNPGDYIGGGTTQTEQWLPEVLGTRATVYDAITGDDRNQGHRICLISHAHGPLWGDVTATHLKYPKVQQIGVGGSISEIDAPWVWQEIGNPRFRVPPDIQSQFFPDSSMLWPECQWDDNEAFDYCARRYQWPWVGEDHPNNGEFYAGTPGKPVVIRQRGYKLWVVHLISIGWSALHLGDWGHVWGTTVRVIDIRSKEPPESEAWTDAYAGYSMAGPPWETKWERSDLVEWGQYIGAEVTSYTTAAPFLPACMFGVGNDQICFIDLDTHLSNRRPETLREFHIVNPYDGTALKTAVNIGAGFWNFNPDNATFPGGALDNPTNPSDVTNAHYWRFPMLSSPRDFPWCVGQRGFHTDLWVGQYRPHPSTLIQTNTDGNIANYEDLNVVNLLQTPLAIPSLAISGDEPWNSAVPAYDPPIEDAEQIAPLPNAGDVGFIEIRDYDRVPANDFRGAIDAVTWHEGWSAWWYGGLGGSADMEIKYDLWRTLQRNSSYAIPDTTGSYIWIRRQSLDPLPPGGGIRPNSTYEVIDLQAEHDDPTRTDISPVGVSWICLGLTITPFGDVIYVLISQNRGDDILAEPLGRRWKIVRPGWWEIETRVPWIKHDSYSTLPEFSAFSDNWYGDISNHNEWNKTASQNALLKVTCNEHWLYLSNFHARATPTHNLRRPDIYPTEDNFIEESFSSPEIGFDADGSNLGPETEPGLTGIQYSTNVFFDWSIDLNTGKIRVPWRTHYIGGQNRGTPASLYGTYYNYMPSDTDDTDITVQYFDAAHQNRFCYANTDTPAKVMGTTPTPTFH